MFKVRATESPACWDAESVAQSVEFGGRQVRTLFDGVFQVPPGHYLLATEKHLQVISYWDFNYPRVTEQTRQRSDLEYVAEFLAGMDEAARVANDQILMFLTSACVLQERFQLAA